MKKWILIACCLMLIAITAAAKSYYSEYRDGWSIIIFNGDIPEDKEGDVRRLQTLYLETLNHFPHDIGSHRLHQFEMELNKLGVTITEIEDDPFIPSENATPYFSPDAPSGSKK